MAVALSRGDIGQLTATKSDFKMATKCDLRRLKVTSSWPNKETSGQRPTQKNYQ